MTWRTRYLETYKLYIQTHFPNVWKDGHYCDPLIPDVTKTNGLTDFCFNMINWSGGRVKRVNVVVRQSDKIVKEASGNMFKEKRFTRSIKKGTADLIGSLRGKALNIEIKNKYTNDKMRESQMKEMNNAIRSGELYWIVTCAEDFLTQLDAELYG